MTLRPSTWLLILGWTLTVGVYAAGALLIPPGPRLTAFGDVMQCLAPLLANMGLLLNASSTHWRKNAFWMLLAAGCSMWMVGQLLWTYYEVGLAQTVPNPFIGDVIFFLHIVPMFAALALRPHERLTDRSLRFAYLDFLLLLCWWVYLYAFVVIPWQYIMPEVGLYGHSFNFLYTLQNVLFLGGLMVLWFRATGHWRVIYAHLFIAGALYAMSSQTINVAIDLGRYHTGSLYDIPLVASFAWFGHAGIIAWRRLRSLPAETAPVEAPVPRALRPMEGHWVGRLARGAVLSLPLMAAWNMELSVAAWPVREFRLTVTLLAMAVLTTLIFFRQHLVDQERQRLLAASQESLDNLKRLQSHLAQSERLAALGQLAAGAAHEINNPLTAILGYADVILTDRFLHEKQKTLIGKIQEQARRTRTLVTNLLSFARKMPAAKTFIDIQAVVRSAVQLRTLDLRDENIYIQFECESVTPGVRGDPHQLLQVFYNLISNAVDAMRGSRGGVLTVRAKRERGHVVIEFSDSGPGLQDPDRVFDPFYTTKPNGTGLGLSICYGIIREHEGAIHAFNRSEGGATFRIELPAVQAVLPASAALTIPSPEPLADARPAPLAPPAPIMTPAPSNAASASAAPPDAILAVKPNVG
jgi:signal transduction histidine kinase